MNKIDLITRRMTTIATLSADLDTAMVELDRELAANILDDVEEQVRVARGYFDELSAEDKAACAATVDVVGVLDAIETKARAKRAELGRLPALN